MVRFKNRYLLLELIWKDIQCDWELDERGLQHAIRQSMQENFGEVGLGLVGESLTVKYANSDTNLYIVRCNREAHQQVWCAITLIKEIRQRTVLPRLLNVGGTIRTSKIAALKHSLSILNGLELGPEYAAKLSLIEQRLSKLMT